MTEDFYNSFGSGDIHNIREDAETLSELLEQESRRYSRKITQEDEAMIR